LRQSFFLAQPGALSAEPAVVAKQTRAWRTQHEHEILAEFAELLAIPNIAGGQPNIERNVKAIRAMFEKRGLATQLLTLDGAPPIVVADVRVSESHWTIAFYAHYDGQPVDAPRWMSDPWKPVMRDGNAREVDWRVAKSELAAIMTKSGHDPIRLPTVGGSIPMYLLQQPDNTPVVGLPIANYDDNQHAADENIRLQNLWDGIEIFACLFTHLSVD
jgi:acetylornithine deacetylase/succinyl-diaminopimelate desuccinylase-like protein